MKRYVMYMAIGVMVLTGIALIGNFWIRGTQSGSSTLLQEELRTVVRLEVPGNTMSHGSGVYIGHGLILTAGHVLEHMPLEAACFGATRKYRVAAVWQSSHSDIGLLAVEKNHCMRAAPISCDKVSVGEPLTLIGMPMDGNWMVAKGIISSPFEQRENTYFVTMPIAPGDSGGPLFNSSGAVVGVVSTQQMSNGGSTPGARYSTGYGAIVGVAGICNELDTLGITGGQSWE